MSKLKEKVALIIGGTTGMGLATAKLFVKEGASVYITGRRKEKLDEAIFELGPRATGVQGDLAHMGDLDRLYDTVRADKGHLDVLFVSAALVMSISSCRA